MKKVKTDRGLVVYVFGAGDGMQRRWADDLQWWRAVAPARRRLAHPAAWYLDAEARARRPLYGLKALALFTERLLWDALSRHDPDGREAVSARRAFMAVRRKMAQMQYRRASWKAERRYLRSCVARCAALARKAYVLVKGGAPEDVNYGRGRPRKDARHG